MRRRPLALLFACLLGLWLAACDLGTKYEPPLVLAATPWIGISPFYVARDRRLLGDTELRIAAMPTDYDSRRAMRDGRADLVQGTLSDILKAIDSGVDLQVILIVDSSNGADGIVARPGIDSLRDLKGCRIGVEIGALTHVVLRLALRHAELREEDVTLVNMSMGEARVALEQGRLDAAVFWEPLLSKVAVAPWRKVFTSAEVPGEIVDILAVRNHVLQSRPDALERLLRAWGEATHSVKQGSPDVLAMAAKPLGLSVEELQESLNGIELVDLQENIRLFDAANTPSAWRSYQTVAQFMVSHGMLEHPVRDPQTIFDPRLLHLAAATSR
jgi:NitT/TauT family transport system substrate-binding protein